jgi:hypothetical protein
VEGVLLNDRTHFAKEVSARQSRAGHHNDGLSGKGPAYARKRISIMVWGETRWSQPILNIAPVGSPLVISSSQGLAGAQSMEGGSTEILPGPVPWLGMKDLSGLPDDTVYAGVFLPNTL